MLTAEIKVNGSLIAHMYIVNEGSFDGENAKYRYEIYHPDDGIIKGKMSHVRSDGALELIRLILEKERK